MRAITYFLAVKFEAMALNITNPLPPSTNYNATEVAFVNQKAASVLPYYFSRDYKCRSSTFALPVFHC
jgi:hypothetical protein